MIKAIILAFNLLFCFHLMAQPLYKKTLVPITTIPTGAFGYDFKDIDSDGDFDIITKFSGPQNIVTEFHLYENLGNDIYSNPVLIYSSPFLSQIQGFKLGDINTDGFLDLVLIQTDSLATNHELIVLLNQGSQTFSSPIVVRSFLGNINLFRLTPEIADINLDGKTDIILANKSQNNIAVFISEQTGVGNGSSWSNYALPDSMSISNVKVADINNDGNQDLVTNWNNRLYFYFGTNQGTLGSRVSGPANSLNWHSKYVNLDDLNNDGFLDVVISNYSFVEYCINNGLGNFSSSQYLVDTANYIGMHDMNKDGSKDIVLTRKSEVIFYEINSNQIVPSFTKYDSLSQNQRAFFGLDFLNDSDLDFPLLEIGTGFVLFENISQQNLRYRGQFFYDRNQNKIKDINEEQLLSFEVRHPLNSVSVVSNNGFYSVATDSGTHTIGFGSKLGIGWYTFLWNLTTDSVTFTRNVSQNNPVVDSLDFGFFPTAPKTIVEPSLSGGFPRCNSIINYWINLKNYGNTKPKGKVKLLLDDSIQFISALIIPDSISGNQFFWNIDSLSFASDYSNRIRVRMPNFNSIGSTVKSQLIFNEIHSQTNLAYSVEDSLAQLIRCAYDPNDKVVFPKGLDTNGIINVNQKLEYLIRFQNTGNDTAINVLIKDQISQHFKNGSARVVASSHPVETSVGWNGELLFNFKNIFLPDSVTNEPMSHGFIRFSVLPKTWLPANTRILNKAEIYFDSNPAIVTNTVVNTIGCDSSSGPEIVQFGNKLFRFSGFYYDDRWYRNDTLITSGTDVITPTQSGIYTLESEDTLHCWTKSAPYLYYSTGLRQNRKGKINIYPNPSQNQFYIQLEDPGTRLDQVYIRNLSGQIIKRFSPSLTIYPIEDLARGIYLIEVLSNKGIYIIKFIKS